MPEYSSKIVNVDGLDVELIRSGRRTLSIEVDARGLKARAPQRMMEATVKQFVREKRPWIDDQMQRIAPPLENIKLTDGAMLPFMGKQYRLQVLPGSRSKPSIQQNVIRLPVVCSHLPLAETVHNKLLKWYKQQAQIYLRQRVRETLPRLFPDSRKRPPSVSVREYRRRWGSCEHKGNISFNWRIIMAPAEVIDYVIVHELAHLVEFNHSKRFWQIVEQTLPDWRQHSDWLHAHGAELYRF